MKREDLLKNKGYWISKIQIDLYSQLEGYMTDNNLNRTQLAKRLGVSKGYISQVLNGDFNHRLSKLVELSLSIDKFPEIKFKDLNKLLNEENEGVKTVTIEYQIKRNDKDDFDLKEQSSININESILDVNTKINLSVVNY